MEVVAVGTPEQIAACERSHTGRYLRDALVRTAPARRSPRPRDEVGEV